MSFEGYYQRLCKQGHYSEFDVYSEQEDTCYLCGDVFVWENLVDETNGIDCSCFDDEGCEHCDNGRIDGYVEPEPVDGLADAAEYCEHCGNVTNHPVPRYKIPVDKGRKLCSKSEI